MNDSSLALRPYLENIEELCRVLDRDSLLQCILALAKQVQPGDRQIFLQNFRAILPGNEHRDIALSTLEESFLLNEIEHIRKEIVRRIESIDGGSPRNADGECHHIYSTKDPKVLN